MVLVFDMDDTLYDELTYVHSGFRSVSEFLARLCGKPAGTLFREMLRLLDEHGRGRVFDAVLEDLGLRTNALVRRCVGVYRTHRPAIRLWPEARACLRRYAHLPLYIVTDGNLVAQQAKAEALGLERIARKVMLTHRYGVCHSKPSPYCFQRIAEWERRPPSEIVYVGDNLAKDFVGIRPLGFRTVRVLRGLHARVQAKPSYDAEVTIGSLADLDLRRIFGRDSAVAHPTRKQR